MFEAFCLQLGNSRSLHASLNSRLAIRQISTSQFRRKITSVKETLHHTETESELSARTSRISSIASHRTLTNLIHRAIPSNRSWLELLKWGDLSSCKHTDRKEWMDTPSRALNLSIARMTRTTKSVKPDDLLC